MQWGAFAGNEAAKKQLAAQLDRGHYPHALLIEGAPGSGRRTLAMTVARAAVCRRENPAERPCGRCAACRKTNHPDIQVIGGDGAAISVDTVRQVRDSAFVVPNESDYRVMILADAQGMNVQAQNALLKVLEEPPAHALFILTCDNRASLLETVRSRCMGVTLAPVAYEEAAPLLRQQLPGQTEEERQRAHSLFGGYIGQVIRGVEEGTFKQVLELTPQLGLAVAEVSELPLLRLTARLEKEKELTAGVLAGLKTLFRDALVLRCGGETLLSAAPEAARTLSRRLTAQKLTRLVEATEGLQTALQRNMNNTLFLTRLCACLRQAAGY